MTGDQLKGYSPWFRLAGKSGVQNTIKMLTDPIERRRIPYAVTFGNHDIQCGISSEEQAELYCQQPYGVCPEEGAAGGGSFANFQLVATVVTLVSYMPMANLSCRIGRKVTTYIGIGLMCLGGFCVFLTQGYSPRIYVWVSIAGIGMGTVATTIYPMIMEVASEKTTGRYTGYYYTASMSAQIITPVLSGAVMEFNGYRYLYLYAVTCAIFAALPLIFVKKGNTVLLKDLEIGDPGNCSSYIRDRNPVD